MVENEEETPTPDKPKETVKDTDNGDTPKEKKSKISPLEEMKKTADRIEEANKKTEELQKTQEDLIVRQELGGGTEAGTKAIEETEDEKWAKDAKIRYEGTGMDPTD